MRKYFFNYFRKNKRNIIDKKYIYYCLLSYDFIVYSVYLFAISFLLLIIYIVTHLLAFEFLTFVMFFGSLIFFIISTATASSDYFIYEDDLISKDYDGKTGRYLLKFRNYPTVFGVSKYIFDDINVGERLCIIISSSKTPYTVIKKGSIPYGDDVKDLLVNSIEELDKKVEEFNKVHGMNDISYKDVNGNAVSKLDVVGKELFDIDKFKESFVNEYKFIGRNNVIAGVFCVFSLIILVVSTSAEGALFMVLPFLIIFTGIGILTGVNATLNFIKYYKLITSINDGRLYYKVEQVVELANYSNYYTTSNYPIKVKTDDHSDFFVASQHYVYDLSVGNLVYTFYLDDKYYFMLSEKYYEIASEFRKR